MRRTERAALELVGEFEELRLLLSEHLDEHEGELLEYLLIADVERWAEAALPQDPGRVQELLDRLEQLFVQAQGDKDVESWIAFGFLEELPRPPDPSAVLRDMLGPVLREVMHEHRM